MCFLKSQCEDKKHNHFQKPLMEGRMRYFYAYHGPNRKFGEFDYRDGLGVSEKLKKRVENISVGDCVFVIQGLKDKRYQLCGMFKVTGHYQVSEKVRKQNHRVTLSPASTNRAGIDIDEEKLSQLLPDKSGNQSWSNFQRHFCLQGGSLKKELDNRQVISILKNLLPHDIPKCKDEVERDFQQAVQDALNSPSKKRKERLARASTKAEKQIVSATVFKRNPDVVAEVLLRAKGKCEACDNEAPFKRATDNSPYLEVHHKIRLADNGDDSVENAIALCPNCHREAHFGI